jgi:hypothetical protein
MMSTQGASSENDVLYQFAMSYQHPDAEQLDEYVRRYPQHADALTILAVELSLEKQLEASESADEAYEADSQAQAMLSRAMSHFQNLLYEIRTSDDAQAPESHPTRVTVAAVDLLAHRTPAQMQDLGKNLDVSPLFLKRVRDKEIRLDTIPARFVALLAQALEVALSEVRLYLSGPPEIAAHLKFKSDVTPAAGHQMTFEQAVRSSALNAEQQERLLSL